METFSNEELKQLGESTQKLSELWKSPEGDELRTILSGLTEIYMREVMDGDPHAFRAVRAMHDIAKELGDQELYVRQVRVEFERRYRMNGGR